MARNESAANQAMVDAYGAFSNERARWVQVLGESRKPRAVRAQRNEMGVLAFSALACVITAACGAMAIVASFAV